MENNQNESIILDFYEKVMNQGNMDFIDEATADNYIEHQTPPGASQDKAGLKKLVAMFRSGFPDLHITVEDIVSAGDKVVARSTMTGTHTGEFMGISPTGKRVSMTSIDIVRFADGKAVEHWGNEDDLGLMQQIGAVS